MEDFLKAMPKNRARRPDAQAFDEIRITTVPRYKTSGISGNEWRISAKIQFFRKGEVIFENFVGNLETAVNMLPFLFIRAIDDGKAYFAGYGNLCDQEGCDKPAVVVYRMKRAICSCCGMEDARSTEVLAKSPTYRCFCQEHSKRGDWGLDDTDSNYELVLGTPREPKPDDVKPAQFGGTITI